MKLKINGEVKLTLADIEVELIEDDLDELDEEIDYEFDLDDEEDDELSEEEEEKASNVVTFAIDCEDEAKRKAFIKLGKLLGVISEDIDGTDCSCVKLCGEDRIALADMFIELGKKDGVIHELHV